MVKINHFLSNDSSSYSIEMVYSHENLFFKSKHCFNCIFLMRIGLELTSEHIRLMDDEILAKNNSLINC